MTDLHFLPVDGDADLRDLEDWRHVHNTIIPPHRLTLEDVRERAVRNRLEVVRHGGVLVGNSTVRPPADGSATATVIVRVLPGHRRQGIGERLYARALRRARELGAETIETVVLQTNTDGLRFALRHGFAETDRYVLDGDTVPYVDLRLTAPDGRGDGREDETGGAVG